MICPDNWEHVNNDPNELQMSPSVWSIFWTGAERTDKNWSTAGADSPQNPGDDIKPSSKVCFLVHHQPNSRNAQVNVGTPDCKESSGDHLSVPPGDLMVPHYNCSLGPSGYHKLMGCRNIHAETVTDREGTHLEELCETPCTTLVGCHMSDKGPHPGHVPLTPYPVGKTGNENAMDNSSANFHVGREPNVHPDPDTKVGPSPVFQWVCSTELGRKKQKGVQTDPATIKRGAKSENNSHSGENSQLPWHVHAGELSHVGEQPHLIIDYTHNCMRTGHDCWPPKGMTGAEVGTTPYHDGLGTGMQQTAKSLADTQKSPNTGFKVKKQKHNK